MEKTIDQRIADLQADINKLEEQKALVASKNNPLAIKTLTGIYEKLGIDQSKDRMDFDGFTPDDYNVIANIVSRMRICKVYNKGILPTKRDKRWYPWSFINKAGSGLVFNNSYYDDGHAHLNSASRLSFLTEEASTAYFKNFQKIEEGIVQL